MIGVLPSIFAYMKDKNAYKDAVDTPAIILCGIALIPRPEITLSSICSSR